MSQKDSRAEASTILGERQDKRRCGGPVEWRERWQLKWPVCPDSSFRDLCVGRERRQRSGRETREGQAERGDES